MRASFILLAVGVLFVIATVWSHFGRSGGLTTREQSWLTLAAILAGCAVLVQLVVRRG